jgi:hypothetical protein
MPYNRVLTKKNLFIVIAFAGMMLPEYLLAQAPVPAAAPLRLIATRRSHRHEFKADSRLRIRFRQGNTVRTVRGVIATLSKDSLIVMPRSHGALVKLAVKDIFSVRRLPRHLWVIQGVVIAVSLPLVLATQAVFGQEDHITESFVFVVAFANLTLAGVTIPVILALQGITTKLSEDGWNFTLE